MSEVKWYALATVKVREEEGKEYAEFFIPNHGDAEKSHIKVLVTNTNRDVVAIAIDAIQELSKKRDHKQTEAKYE